MTVDNITNIPKIHVISCGIQAELSKQCQALLAQADVIFASRTLLADVAMKLNASAEHRPITAQAKDNAKEAIACACLQGQGKQGCNVVILTSGDALYHGFGGTLINAIDELRVGEDDDTNAIVALPKLVFHPNITAFQELFHRLGLPWSESKLFSVHSGHDNNLLPLRQFTESPLCVIYAGLRFLATNIAQKLVDFLPKSASRPAVLAEQLGSPQEHIIQASLEEIAKMTCGPTSILLLMPHSSCSTLPLVLGLAEEFYERERNLITASDARAIILSRLRLPSQGLMWDIGAGSGSVGLEAATLRPELDVVAVERKAERVAMVHANAQKLGITNHFCVTGEAIPSIKKLEGKPDRIFIGGGGAEIAEILHFCMDRLAPDGLVIVSSVTLESFTALYQFHPEWRRDVTTISIARETTIAGQYHHMRHQNSLSLFTFSK